MSADGPPRGVLVDRLAAHVRSLALRGDGGPVDRPPTIEQMARSLGTGPGTLRQALALLEAEDVVEIRYGTEVHVKRAPSLLPDLRLGEKATKELLLDLVVARIQIETSAIGLAAVRAGTADLAHLHALLAESEGCLGDEARLGEANRAFHHAVARASGNPVLAQLQRTLSNTFQQEQQALLTRYGSHEQDHREHVDLLHVLHQRDAALASERMKAHFSALYQAALHWDDARVPLG